jgi:hypothetical protein
MSARPEGAAASTNITMKPHEQPGFDRTSAAAWDAIVPGEN